MEIRFYQDLTIINVGQTQEQFPPEANISLSCLQELFQNEAFQQEQLKQQKYLISASIHNLIAKMPNITGELINIILSKGYSIREKSAAYSAVINEDFDLSEQEVEYLFIELKEQIQEQAALN